MRLKWSMPTYLLINICAPKYCVNGLSRKPQICCAKPNWSLWINVATIPSGDCVCVLFFHVLLMICLAVCATLLYLVYTDHSSQFNLRLNVFSVVECKVMIKMLLYIDVAHNNGKLVTLLNTRFASTSVFRIGKLKIHKLFDGWSGSWRLDKRFFFYPNSNEWSSIIVLKRNRKVYRRVNDRQLKANTHTDTHTYIEYV